MPKEQKDAPRFGTKTPQQTGGIQTVTGQAIESNIEDIIDIIVKNAHVKDYLSFLGSVISGRATNINNLSALKNVVGANKGIFKTMTTIEASAKSMKESLVKISANMSMMMDAQMQYYSSLIENQGSQEGSPQPGMAIGVVLDTTNAKNFEKIIESLALIGDENIKAFSTMVQAAIDLGVKVDLKELNDKFVEPINSLTKVEAKEVSKKITEMNDSNTVVNLKDMLDKLSEIKFDASSTKEMSVGIDSLVNAMAKISEGPQEKELKSNISKINMLAKIVNGGGSKNSGLVSLSQDLSKLSAVDKTTMSAIDSFITAMQHLNEMSKNFTEDDVKEVIRSINDMKAIVEKISEMAESTKENSIVAAEAMASLVEVSDSIADGYLEVANNLQKARVYTEKSEKDMEVILGNHERIADLAKDVKEETEEIDTKSINISMESIASCIIKISLVMLIGSWILQKNPTLLKDTIKFGLVLSTFMVVTIGPLLLITKLANLITDAESDIEAFANAVMKLSFALLLSTWIYSLLGLKASMYAMMFIKDINIFTLSIIGTLSLLSKIADDADVIDGYVNIVAKLSLIMMVGALFMLIGGGKLAEAAMSFALSFALFTTIVLMPLVLIEKFVSEDTNISAFGEYVVDMTAVMVIGAIFMTLGGGKMALAALKFGLILAGFITLMVLPLALLNAFGGFGSIDEEEGKGSILDSFRNYVIAMSATLIIGGLFMLIGNGKMAIAALEFAGIVTAFLLANVLIMKLASKTMTVQTKRSIEAFKDMVVEFSLILAIGAGLMFIQDFGKNALKFAGIVAGFTLVMAGIFMLIAKSTGPNSLRSLKRFTMSVVILSGTMMLMAYLAKDLEWKDIIKALVMVGVACGLLVAMVLILGNDKTATKALKAGFTLVLMSIAIGILSYSLGIAASAMQIFAWEDVGKLFAIVLGLIGVFALLIIPAVMAAVVVGAIVFTLMGFALNQLANALMVIHNLQIKEVDKDIAKFEYCVTTLIETFQRLFGEEGSLKPLFRAILGAVLVTVTAALLVGAFLAIKIIGLINPLEAIDLVKIAVEKYIDIWLPFQKEGSEKPGRNWLALLNSIPISLLIMTSAAFLTAAFISLRVAMAFNPMKQINQLMPAMKALVEVFGYINEKFSILPGFLTGKSGTVNLIELGLKTSYLHDVILDLARPIRQISKTANFIKKEHVDVLVIKKFLEDFASIFSDDKNTNVINKIANEIGPKTMRKFKRSVRPLMKAIGRMGETTKDLADLKVAIAWNNRGKPIDYRRLTENDFKKVQTNVNYMFSTFFSPFDETKDGSFMKTYKTMIEEYIGQDTGLFQIFKKQSKFGAGISLALKISELVGSMGESVKSFADLMIPTAWNQDTGKPISFRPMKEDDFKNAAGGINKIISTILDGIDQFTKDYEPLIEEYSRQDTGLMGMFRSSSKIGTGLNISFKVAELVGTMGQSLKEYADAKFAVKWDKDGRPTKFITLGSEEFNKVTDNIALVLGCMVTSLENAFFGEDGKGGNHKSLKKFFEDEDGLTAIMNGITLCMQTVADISNHIKSISELKIATFDPTGKETGYVSLDKTRIETAGGNVQSIMTEIPKAFFNAAKELEKSAGTEGWQEKIQLVQDVMNPINEMMSSMITNIQNYANLRYPVKYKDGVPVDWAPFDLENGITKMTSNFITLFDGLTQCIIDTHEKFKNSEALNQETGAPALLKSIQSVVGVFKDIIDVVQAYANFKSPIYGKDGKITGYDTFAKGGQGITNLMTDFESNLKTMITGIANAVTNSGTELTTLTKNQGYIDALSSVSGMAQDIGSIIDVVTKLYNAKYPDPNLGFDKDGNPKGWKSLTTLDSSTLSSKISEIILAVPNAVNSAWKTGEETIKQVFGYTGTEGFIYNFDSSDNTNTTFGKISSVVGLSVTLVKSLSTIMQDLSNWKIPTKYDKQGNPIGFITVGQTDFSTVKQNLSDIISAMPEAVNNGWAKISGSLGDNPVEKINDIKTVLLECSANIMHTLPSVLDAYLSIKDKLREVKPSEISNKVGPILNNLATMYVGVLKIFGADDSKEAAENVDKTIKIMQIIINDDIAKTMSGISNNMASITDSVISMKDSGGKLKDAITKAGENIIIDDQNGIGTIDSFGKDFSKMIKDIGDAFSVINTSIKGNYKAITSKTKDMEKIVEVLKSYSSEDGFIPSLTKSIKDLADTTYKYLKGNYAKYVKENMSIIITDTANVITSVQTALNGKEFKRDSAKQLNRMINLYSSYIESMRLLNDIYVGLKDQENIDIASLSNENWMNAMLINDDEEISKFKKLVESINPVASLINELSVSLFRASNTVRNFEPSSFNDILGMVVDFSNAGKMIDLEGIKNIENEIDVLDEYVKTINSLESPKLNQTIRLFESMNNLSSSIGNLDEFTKVLANEISVALVDLTNQINDAKNVINVAEQQRKKRQEELDDTIKKIEKLMSKPLNVNVSSGTDKINAAYENPRS